MDYNILPNSDIKVSKICLGTMTWGRQNSQKEAFDQMNYSLERGIMKTNSRKIIQKLELF